MRWLAGVGFSSGLEGADAAVLQASGVGWELRPRLVAAVRVPFSPALRDWCLRCRFGTGESLPTPDHIEAANTALQALRQALARASIGVRDLFVCGLLEPAAATGWFDWVELAARLAEQTGCTVVHSLRQRDRAAGGSGRMLTALADYLLIQHLPPPRLWIHLGHIAAILYLPATGSKQPFGFEAGPGNHWIDAVIYHGTRGREACDAGGKRAVQGRCWEPLLSRWQEHPYLLRRPPKTTSPDTFGRPFLLSAFSAARAAGLTLPDLLCTATHWIARTLFAAVQKWLPSDALAQPVLVSGGGVRNGFLWQLLTQHFPRGLQRSDQIGIPPLARQAAAAAILAALSCDGIAGQSPYLTGALGGRWLGNFCPGDPRHWSRLCAWLADQSRDLAQLRAA